MGCLGLLVSFSSLACVPTESNSAETIERFANAMLKADHVVEGSVYRLYKLPSWEKGFQGAVLQVIDDLKGYAPDFVDVAYTPIPNYSPEPKQAGDYWPLKAEKEALFAVNKENGAYFVTAVADSDEKLLFKSCLKYAEQQMAMKRKKFEEEVFKLPDHLKVDHNKEIFGEE